MCAEDSVDLAELYAELINSEADMACVGCLSSADDLVASCERLGADVAVVDLTMPGRRPLEAIAELMERMPAAKVIVVSGRDDPDVVDEAVRAGAWGFVSKHASVDAIVRAIRKVAAGELGVVR